MKKLLIGLLFASLLLCGTRVNAYVSVKGYYRSNGTYVAPYVRSNPNGLKYDNYGYQPSQGLYNPSYGTKDTSWDTPTYITDPDYYIGKSIYTGNSTYSAPYSYNAALPTKDVSYTTKLWVDNNPTSSCSQSTFLRAKERLECESYKTYKNSYDWNVTTSEYDGRHYRYDPETKLSYSCPDGLTILYDNVTGKPTTSCTQDLLATFVLPAGCTTNNGFSVINGLSCLSNTCALGLSWNGRMCVSN